MMTEDNVDVSTAEKLRELYRSSDIAKSLFDSIGNRQNDAYVTTVDRICDSSTSNRSDVIEFCKTVDRLQIGRFLIGRKGRKSRVEWSYSLLKLSDIARGEDLPLYVDWKDAHWPAPKRELADAASNSGEPRPKLTIQMDKQLLAESLGVSADSIEITIRI